MAKEYDPNQIIANLDKWVKVHGNGKYVRADFESPVDNNFGIPENFGIQQVKEEIQEFIGILSDKNRQHDSALEIGLGYFGSTHFLWRHLFNNVTTIEKNHDRVRSFGENTQKFYNKWVADDGKSSFLIGFSNDSDIVNKAYQFLENKLDLLFIDGDHRYQGVLTDWLIYNPLVKEGGIVAFHDANASVDNYGVPRFLKNLETGKLDGRLYPLKRIIHSKDAGIAYYEKTF